MFQCHHCTMDRTFEIATHFGLSIREAEAAGWSALAVECAPCGTTTHISLWRLMKSARVGFFQEVVDRMRCHACGAEPSGAYMVREVKRPDPLKRLNFRIEEWSLGGEKPVELIAATLNAFVANAAYDAILPERPNRPIGLRERARLLRSTFNTDPPPSNIVPMAAARPEEESVPLRLRRAK
ncbi:hypothetical protein [uncultured Pleomorphomonas sp.]|nr:hypothetical protein [uncultured Pleomorphomonas sp.]